MIKFAELVCYSFAQRGERIMIEVIYEKEKEKAEGNQAFFRIPNNIRQIGEIQGNQKIYIEDYAYTYLCRIASEDSAKGRAAILLGQANWKDGKTYLFIKSAVALHDIEVSEEHFAFTKDVWKQIYEENKKFFPNQEIVGWFLSLPGCSMELHEGISKTHFNHFGGNEKVLMVMEPLEKEEAFYRYEEGKLTRQEGFYVYYEKNEPMQNFLIEQNKYARERSEKVADEAVKTFRKKVEEKTKGKKRDKIAPLFRMASASAAAAMLIAGVLYLNQYEKLKKTNSIADKAKIENEIKTMENYFVGYETVVNFISQEELDRNHKGIPHGGFVLRSGESTEGTRHVVEYSLKLDSNPEFTSSVLVAYARAAYKLSKEGQSGCKTVFDIAPAYLSAKSGDELRASLL